MIWGCLKGRSRFKKQTNKTPTKLLLVQLYKIKSADLTNQLYVLCSLALPCSSYKQHQKVKTIMGSFLCFTKTMMQGEDNYLTFSEPKIMASKGTRQQHLHNELLSVSLQFYYIRRVASQEQRT